MIYFIYYLYINYYTMLRRYYCLLAIPRQHHCLIYTTNNWEHREPKRFFLFRSQC